MNAVVETVSDTSSSDSEAELLLQDIKPEENNHNTHDCYKYDSCSEPEKSSCLTRWNWKNIITITCLLLAYFLCNMSYSIVGPFFPDEAENKGASPLVVGIIIGCAPFSLVILSPVLGYLLPRTGLLLPIFLGLLLVGTSYIALAFVLLVPSTWGFISLAITLRLVEGAGSAMFVTATYATLPKLFPHNISTMMALIEVAAGFGYGIGPPVGGAFYKAGGYKIPFLATGIPVLLLIIPCTVLVWKIEIDESDRATLSIKTVFKLSTSLTMIALALAIVLAYGCFGFYETTLQPFLINTFDVPNEQIGLIMCTGAFSYVITALVLGPVVDKIGYNRSFTILGVGIYALSYFSFGITFIGRWYILLLCVAYFFVGIGASFGVVPVYSDMLKVAKRYTSKTDTQAAVGAFVSGIISSSLYLGEFSGSLIGGLLTNYLSFPRSAVVIGDISLIEVLLLIGVTAIDRCIYS